MLLKQTTAFYIKQQTGALGHQFVVFWYIPPHLEEICIPGCIICC
jgi:hypothetical protein